MALAGGYAAQEAQGQCVVDFEQRDVGREQILHALQRLSLDLHHAQEDAEIDVAAEYPLLDPDAEDLHHIPAVLLMPFLIVAAQMRVETVHVAEKRHIHVHHILAMEVKELHQRHHHVGGRGDDALPQFMMMLLMMVEDTPY